MHASMLIVLFALATLAALWVVADSALRAVAIWRQLRAAHDSARQRQAVRVRFTDASHPVTGQVVPLVRARAIPVPSIPRCALRAAA